jgi:glutaredoxin 2
MRKPSNFRWKAISLSQRLRKEQQVLQQVQEQVQEQEPVLVQEQQLQEQVLVQEQQ